ncbi:MAG: LysM peptidoglycan-binding domain-containing protein [Verrucomicrobiota bacterium]|nr:LysM peptidoglycan-binding domain-containing protein [Verrucomicrobiota bacterium]
MKFVPVATCCVALVLLSACESTPKKTNTETSSSLSDPSGAKPSDAVPLPDESAPIATTVRESKKSPAKQTPTTSASTTAQAQLSPTGSYKVQKGDSLWKIANQFKVSIEDIKAANGLDTDKIQPGQELSIPTNVNRP